jgi:hypothetical protein
MRRDGDTSKIGLVLLKEVADAVRVGRLGVLASKPA